MTEVKREDEWERQEEDEEDEEEEEEEEKEKKEEEDEDENEDKVCQSILTYYNLECQQNNKNKNESSCDQPFNNAVIIIHY